MDRQLYSKFIQPGLFINVTYYGIQYVPLERQLHDKVFCNIILRIYYVDNPKNLNLNNTTC